MGIMRAGYVPFPISTRNSPAGVAHLLEKTGAKHLIVGLDPAMQSLAADAIQTLKSQHPSVTVLTTSQMPVFGDLYSEHLGPVEVDVPYEKPSPQQLVFLLHSSGEAASMMNSALIIPETAAPRFYSLPQANTIHPSLAITDRESPSLWGV